MDGPRARNCISHCRKCNLCFSSDTAFDMHITHDGELVDHNEPATMRYEKGVRKGDLRFESHPGTCVHQVGCWSDGRVVKRVPVTIWSMSMTDEQRARLASLNASSATGGMVS